MSIQIKGSRGYYSVDINKLTCTCKDFTCRRHHYPLDDPKRLCKHIREAIELQHDCMELKSSNSVNSFDRHISERYLSSIIPILESDNNILRFQIVGDYRRKLPEISEIVIVARVLYKNILTSLTNNQFKLISSDDREEIYVTDCGLRIRIMKIDDDTYPFEVLSLTGSPNFMIMMKSSALKFGLKLSECGFIKDNNILDTDIGNENDIFEYLGLDYIKPEDRI